MQGSDLAFHTTEELVGELMNRKTFLGLVLHSEKDLKSAEWKGDMVFRLHLNANLQSREACRLLDKVVDYLETEAD